MPLVERFLASVVLNTLVLVGGEMMQQAPPKKAPALIRDTGVAEGKTEAETVIKKEYNPLQAERNLEIGKSYFRKGNYDAAISRFQDAIEYQPSLIAAYDALGRAYEKKGDKARAAAVYKEFITKNPDSSKAADFKSRASRLEKGK